MSNNKAQERVKGISGSVLKTIALICMLIDHTGHHIIGRIDELNQPLLPFNIDGEQVSVYYIFRFIGRIAFPIYAYLLIEGYKYTRNLKRYTAGLFIFALVSEVPFNLALNGTLFYQKYQNVFFTLALGLCTIIIYDKICRDIKIGYALIALIIVFGYWFRIDYSWFGITFILYLYISEDFVEKNKNARMLQGLVGIIFFKHGWKQLISYFLIAQYNGERGFIGKDPIKKYAFYMIYPLHLLILYIIAKAMFG